jgi:hypothetical protein
LLLFIYFYILNCENITPRRALFGDVQCGGKDTKIFETDAPLGKKSFPDGDAVAAMLVAVIGLPPARNARGAGEVGGCLQGAVEVLLTELCCSLVVRLLFACCPFLKRTTSEQQADNRAIGQHAFSEVTATFLHSRTIYCAFLR